MHKPLWEALVLMSTSPNHLFGSIEFGWSFDSLTIAGGNVKLGSLLGVMIHAVMMFAFHVN